MARLYRGRQRLQDRQAGFTGGLNTTSDPDALTASQVRQASNTRLGQFGAITKRGGTRVASAAIASGANGMKGFFWPSKFSILFMAGNPSHLYTAPRVTFTTTWTLIPTDQGAWVAGSRFVAFSDAAGDAVYATGPVALRKWDNAAISSPAGAAACLGLVVYNQRLWGWNTTASHNSLYFSSFGNGDTLGIAASGGGQIVLQTYGSYAIQACTVVGASLLIFQTGGVSRLTGFGQDDISVSPQPLSNECNIIGPEAYCATTTVAYVSTMRGLYAVTEGAATLVGTPQNPDPTVAVLANANLGSGTNLFYNTATNEVWVTIQTVGTYVYHTVLGTWSGPWTGDRFTGTGTGQAPFTIPGANAVGTRTVVAPGTDIDTLYELDSPDYFKDGVAANGTGGAGWTTTIQMHRMFCGDRTTVKAYRQVNILATLNSAATAPTLTYSNQFGGSNTQTFPTPTSLQQPYYFDVGGSGPSIDLTITDVSATQSAYEIVGVDAFELGRR